MAKRANSTMWKPGQSGNPHGQAKDKLFRTAIIMELKSVGEDMPSCA